MKHSLQAISFIIVASLILCAPLSAQISDNPQSPDNQQDQFVELADHLIDSTNVWLRWYGSLPTRWQRFLEPAAISIAIFRRSALRYLIVRAPEIALDDRLGQIDRVSLPSKVVDALETIVDTVGDYQASAYLHVYDAQTDTFTDVLQPAFVSLADTEYPAPKLYGRRIEQPSKVGLPIHGIAIDDAFAWSEEPYRQLDPAELEELQLPPDASAIFSGAQILLIDSENDFEKIRDSLRAREEIPGPFLAEGVIDDILLRTWTTGIKNILWVPVDFYEVPGSRFERSATTDATIEEADEWIRFSSRERSTISVTYFPGTLRLSAGSLDRANALVRMSGPVPVWPYTIIEDTEAALAEYDGMNGGTGQWLPENFDRLAIVVSDALTFEDGEIAAGAFTLANWKMAFYGVDDDFSLNHELGHTYLFGHSFYNVSSTSDPLGPGFVNPARWDFMGQPVGTLGPSHINHPASSAKERAFWMQRTSVCTAATDLIPEVCDARFGGSFRLVAHDNGPDGQLRLLKIPTEDRVYWVAMRRLWPLQPWLNSGVQIHFTRPERNRPDAVRDGLAGPTYIGLRNTALNPPLASPFQAGESFEDTARGVRIRIDGTGEDAGVSFADVTVERF